MRFLPNASLLLLVACWSEPEDLVSSPTDPAPAPPRPMRPVDDTDTAPTGDTATSEPCTPDTSWGQLTAATLPHDGLDRTHQRYVPADHACEPTTLVVGLHGYYGSGQDFATNTSNLVPVLEAQGWIGLFPDGLQASDSGYGAQVTSFNDLTTRNDEGPDGPTCIPSAYDYIVYDNCSPAEDDRFCKWGTSCADDAGYLRALIAEAKAAYAIDRVVLTGFSQGGQTTAGLALALGDAIDVAVPVHGFAANGYTAAPTEPTSILQVWGREDRIVDGTDRPSSDGMIYDSAQETLREWAATQGCDSSPVPYPTASDGTRAWSCLAWPSCSTGAQVVSCAWDGGHVWPQFEDENLVAATLVQMLTTPP